MVLRAQKARARGAPLVRKYGNPSVRENLVLVTVRPSTPPCMPMWPVSPDITWAYRGDTPADNPAGLQRTSLLWSIDTCQNKASAGQYHVTISRAQV